MNRVLRCVVLCAATLAWAGPPVDLSNSPERVNMLAVPHDVSDVRAAVLAGLRAKSWKVAQDDGSKLIAQLSHRGNELQIHVRWDESRFVVQGLISNTDVKRYENYLAGLESAIHKQLRKGARAQEPQAEELALTGEAGDGLPPVMAVFTRDQPFEAVRSVLQRALNARGWRIEADEPNGLIASHQLRGGFVRVRITSTTQQSTITFVDAKNLRAHSEYMKLANALGDAITAASK